MGANCSRTRLEPREGVVEQGVLMSPNPRGTLEDLAAGCVYVVRNNGLNKKGVNCLTKYFHKDWIRMKFYQHSQKE